MSFFEFPGTRTYDNDLGWLIRRVLKLSDTMENFINFNTIKYADPIAWNITTQYESNTVVINPADGTAYLSTKPVPSGVLVTNTDYWTPIFNYGENMDTLREQISAHNEKDSPTATEAYTTGDLVWLNGYLYRVDTDMAAGTAFIPGTNVEKTTIEDELKAAITELQTNLQTQIDGVRETVEKIVSERPVWNVVHEGILPDTGENVFYKLFELFKTVSAAGGGTIYFPRGEYIINDTLYVPDNTIVMGDGYETLIHYNEEHALMGTGICLCGSNSGLKNIRVNTNTSGAFAPGGQLGSVGITTVDESLVTTPHPSSWYRKNVSNIFIDNLWSDTNYLLQTEPDPAHTVSNVYCRNLHCDGGCVSAMPNASSGANIRNLKYENVNCDFFRFGNLDNTACVNMVAENVDCRLAYMISPSTVRNLHVDATGLRATGQARAGDGIWMATDVSLYDSIIENCNVGLACRNGIRHFENVTIRNVTRVQERLMGISDTTNYEIVNNCDWSQTGDTVSVIIGYGNSNKFGDHISSHVFGDGFQGTGVIPDLHGNSQVSGTTPNKIMYSGNTVTLFAYVVFTNQDYVVGVQGTVANRENTFIPVDFFTAATPDTRHRVICSIDSDGHIKPLIAETLTSYNRAQIAYSYGAKYPTPNELYRSLQ